MVSANISSGVTKNPDQESFLKVLKNLALGRQVIAKPTPQKELNKAISLDIEIPPKKTKQEHIGHKLFRKPFQVLEQTMQTSDRGKYVVSE